MTVTIATPSKYTDGRECYVAQNEDYPGIIGQGEKAEDALASFEAARQAYEAMTQVSPFVAPATLTWFKPVTVIGFRPTVPA